MRKRCKKVGGSKNITKLEELRNDREYDVKFFDDEYGDRIEEEFAPIYNGKYAFVKKFSLEFHDHDTYIPGSKIDVVQMERIPDKKIINIVEGAVPVKFKNGDPIILSVPISEEYRTNIFKPLKLKEDDDGTKLDEHYTYAPCVIEDDISDTFLNVSRVSKKNNNNKIYKWVHLRKDGKIKSQDIIKEQKC